MLAGFYTIASGMLTRQREQDTIGNNLTNSQTPGYRADRLLISPFEQELLTRTEANNGRQVLGRGIAATSAVVGEDVTMFGMGDIKDTGRDMDMAIGGEGFYNIQNDQNVVSLTRNGSFDIDDGGYLCLPGFGRVMGENGLIQVKDAKFQVDANGDIYGSDGAFIDKILVTVPQDGTEVVKLGNGMFQFGDGARLPQAQDYVISQRSLELSNVDMNLEMSYLIESQRAFQACSSALQTIDALNRKAATQIGSIS